MASGLETTVGRSLAGCQKLQLGHYLAWGVDHSRIKFAGSDVFAEFGHGDSAVLGVRVEALRGGTGVSFGYARMRLP